MFPDLCPHTGLELYKREPGSKLAHSVGDQHLRACSLPWCGNGDIPVGCFEAGFSQETVTHVYGRGLHL